MPDLHLRLPLDGLRAMQAADEILAEVEYLVDDLHEYGADPGEANVAYRDVRELRAFLEREAAGGDLVFSLDLSIHDEDEGGS